MTWYPQDFVQVPMTDMRMRPDSSSGYPGRTYRFYQGKTVFEFGYGLSYSNYSYEFASVTRDKLHLNLASSPNPSHKISNTSKPMLISQLSTQFCDTVKFSAVIRVKNNGKISGRHPVLLFARAGKQNEGSPMKQLIGFESIDLKEGQERDIEFVVSPCEHLSTANKDGLMALDEGVYHLVVGQTAYQIIITA